MVSTAPPRLSALPAPALHGSDAFREAVLAAPKRNEHELLLWCAGGELGRDEIAEVRRLVRGGLDYDYLLEGSRMHGITQGLYQTLARVAPDLLPAEALQPLQRCYHKAGLLVSLRLDELLAIGDQLASEGVPMIPLKGPVLGLMAYGDLALRKPGDLDVLIRREDYFIASRVLEERGYETRTDLHREGWYLHGRGGRTFVHPACHVDLHWTLEQGLLDSFPMALRFDMDGVWSRRTSMEIRGRTVEVLGPDDHLLFLCMHGIKHMWSKLYLLSDLVNFLQCYPDHEWQPFIDRVDREGCARVIYPGLYLAHALLGAQLPRLLQQHVSSDPDVRVVADVIGRRLFGAAEPLTGMRYHLFRTQLLGSWQKKALYLMLRGLRKVSKTEAWEPD